MGTPTPWQGSQPLAPLAHLLRPSRLSEVLGPRGWHLVDTQLLPILNRALMGLKNDACKHFSNADL